MISFPLNQNASPDISAPQASWMLTMSIIYLIFMLLVGAFFYKILVVNKKCHIPWYGSGVFLMVLVVILGFLGIAGVIMSSIQLSYSLKIDEQRKRSK